MGVIDRRSEDKSVCLFCLGNKGVAEIIFKEASFFRHLLHPMQSRISFTPIGKISLSIPKDFSSAAISSKATCVFPSRLTEPFSISTFIFLLLLSSPLYQEKKHCLFGSAEVISFPSLLSRSLPVSFGSDQGEDSLSVLSDAPLLRLPLDYREHTYRQESNWTSSLRE